MKVNFVCYFQAKLSVVLLVYFLIHLYRDLENKMLQTVGFYYQIALMPQ